MISANALNLFIFKIHIDLTTTVFFLFRLVFDKENDCSNSPDSTSSSADNRPGVVDLSPLQITAETFEIILDYLYTSEIVVDEDNIQNILQAADVFFY